LLLYVPPLTIAHNRQTKIYNAVRITTKLRSRL